MKKFRKKIYKSLWLLRTLIIVCIFVLVFTTTAFASPLINVVSPTEAAELALLYYCLNAEENEQIFLDSYTATPLYDKEGKITYYSIDFFNNDEPKGYVVIGGDLNYIQCPEIFLEGSSIYRNNALEGKRNIYYNPMQVYVEENNITVDLFDEELSDDEVYGEIYEGNLLENRQLLYVAGSSSDNPIIDDAISFAEHPVDHLAQLGFTNANTVTYCSQEAAMDNADAFHPMYNIPQGEQVELNDFFTITNASHCVITAISNVMMYWESICCPNYPDDYDDVFANVCSDAEERGYFNRHGTTGFLGNITNVMHDFNSRYNYAGVTYQENSPSWSFLETYMRGAAWPIIMVFNHHVPSGAEDEAFIYDHHATVGFGYNLINCQKNGVNYTFRFVKMYDGWASGGKRYVCWDMIEDKYENVYEDPIQDLYLAVSMIAFCPYTP